jgi:hypothetical protein
MNLCIDYGYKMHIAGFSLRLIINNAETPKNGLHLAKIILWASFQIH